MEGTADMKGIIKVAQTMKHCYKPPNVQLNLLSSHVQLWYSHSQSRSSSRCCNGFHLVNALASMSSIWNSILTQIKRVSRRDCVFAVHASSCYRRTTLQPAESYQYFSPSTFRHEGNSLDTTLCIFTGQGGQLACMRTDMTGSSQHTRDILAYLDSHYLTSPE